MTSDSRAAGYHAGRPENRGCEQGTRFPRWRASRIAIRLKLTEERWWAVPTLRRKHAQPDPRPFWDATARPFKTKPADRSPILFLDRSGSSCQLPPCIRGRPHDSTFHRSPNDDCGLPGVRGCGGADRSKRLGPGENAGTAVLPAVPDGSTGDGGAMGENDQSRTAGVPACAAVCSGRRRGSDVLRNEHGGSVRLGETRRSGTGRRTGVPLPHRDREGGRQRGRDGRGGRTR